jgi:hypothetical protein
MPTRVWSLVKSEARSNYLKSSLLCVSRCAAGFGDPCRSSAFRRTNLRAIVIPNRPLADTGVFRIVSIPIVHFFANVKGKYRSNGPSVSSFHTPPLPPSSPQRHRRRPVQQAVGIPNHQQPVLPPAPRQHEPQSSSIPGNFEDRLADHRASPRDPRR